MTQVYKWASASNGSWTDPYRWNPSAIPNVYISSNPDVNNEALFATGSNSAYIVISNNFIAKVGILDVEHDTIDFS